MYANLVLSTFAEVQGDWFHQDSFYFVQVCIPCLIKFLLSSAYKLACVFEFPQTVNVSVKSNAFGLHARLNNVRRNTQQFIMILIFACAFFIDLQALQFGRTLGSENVQTVYCWASWKYRAFKCLPNGAPPLTTLWFKNNKLIEKDQQVGGYGVHICNNHRMFFIWDSKYDRAYKINTAVWIDRCFILTHKVHTFHATTYSSVHKLHTWLFYIHPGSWNVVYL